MDPADSKIWNVCCIFYQIFSVSIQHDLCHFTVSQFPAMTGPCRSRAVFFWRARLGFMSRPEKCRNGESWCWKCWMWSELERERGDVGKVEMKRVDLPGAVHLTTTAPSPSAPLPLIILISSFWQFLTVLAETKKPDEDTLKILTRKVLDDIDLGVYGWGRPFFALPRWGSELCLNSHKKRCNYLRPWDDL